MARIRSVKPEFWADAAMSHLSRDARLLYIALWNLADEHGRLHGDPRYVKGQAFPYDDDLTPVCVEALLVELERLAKVSRYWVAGDPYLALPNLGRHQRLEPEKVPSKYPSPDGADKSAPDPDKSARRADKFAPIAVDLGTAQGDEGTRRSEAHPGVDQGSAQIRADKSAPRADESSLLYVAGSMEHVTTTSDALALRADASAAPTAQSLIAEWISTLSERPPGRVISHLGKELSVMVKEGIPPDHIRQGLVIWQGKGLHPSAIASCVHEARTPRAHLNGKQAETDAMFERAAQRAVTRGRNAS